MQATQSIADQLDKDYASAWRPEPDEKIVGELVGVDERLGFNDEPYPILTLRRRDGSEVAVHAFHTVLRNEVGKQNPQLGETIAIKYLGQIAKEGGRGRYHAYKMVIDRARASVDLRKFATDEPDVTPDISTLDVTEPAGSDDDVIPY